MILPFNSIQLRLVSQSSSSTSSMSVELQQRINELLNKSFPNAKEIIVKDISGGCGSMFEVYIATMDFQGMTKVKQHLTVSNVSFFFFLSIKILISLIDNFYI